MPSRDCVVVEPPSRRLVQVERKFLRYSAVLIGSEPCSMGRNLRQRWRRASRRMQKTGDALESSSGIYFVWCEVACGFCLDAVEELGRDEEGDGHGSQLDHPSGKNGEWTGMSCKSTPISHQRISWVRRRTYCRGELGRQRYTSSRSLQTWLAGTRCSSTDGIGSMLLISRLEWPAPRP